MKFTRFYNYEGIFRYLKMGKNMKAKLEKSTPFVNRLLESSVHRRLDGAKWRKLGLYCDDIIIEENDVVAEALKRIPKQELYDRYSRFKVAIHYNMLRRELPENKWVTNDKDKSYLMPFVEQVLSEHEEQEKYNTGIFRRA